MADMIKRIVFIINYPFSRRDYDRFGIAILKKNGFEPEIWDITAILHKDLKKHDRQEDPDFPPIRVFSDETEISESISVLDKRCMVNCFIEFSMRSRFIFRALCRYNIKYCVIQTISFPNPLEKRDTGLSAAAGLFRRATSLRPADIVRQLFNRLLLDHYPWFGIKAADIVLLAGERSRDCRIFPTDEHTVFLWAHALDYDLYLRLQDTKGSPASGKGVFLDEYFPFHPDLKFLGVESPVPPEEYYRALCRFFEILERDLHKQIIIAAHPRSDYRTSPDYFQGRTIIRGDTARLVRDAEFVITHMSTSLNFAILFNKPILFITMDKIQNLDSGKYIPGRYITTIASELKKIPVNIDHWEGPATAGLLRIDPDAYKQYKRHFIKKEGSPELPFWEIYSSHLMKMGEG